MRLYSKKGVNFLLKPKISKNVYHSRLKFTSDSNQDVKNFDQIPGPLSLPFIGTLYQYLPLIGRYSFEKLHLNGIKNYKLFGPIVREEIFPGTVIIWLFDPSDIEIIFRKEGQFPHRKSHSALEKYRLDRPNVYNSGGLLPTNGPQWERVRKAFQKGLSAPSDALTFIPGSDKIIKEWIDVRIEHIYQKNNIDYLPELSRLFLELLGQAAFDTRFESFYSHEFSQYSRSSRLLEAAFVTNAMMLKADNGPQLWRKFETPMFRKLRKAQEYMENVAIDMVALKMSIFEEKDINCPLTLLEKYLSNPAVDFKDVIGIACDFLLAGMDTTTYTTSFLLYHLANNPSAQNRLYEEACRLLPDPCASVTAEIYQKADYAKCCVKESLRMRPISIGVGRVLTSDLVLSNYKIPKGTVVVSGNQVMCRLEKYFPNPDSYIPERWLKGDPLYQKLANNFLFMPFGYGQRTCIAKRFAEQNMVVILLRLLKRFEVKWIGGKLDSKSLLINKPDKPVLLKFEKRG